MRSIAEVQEQVTGRGGPFEFVEEEVLGEKMAVFKQRKRSLREFLETSTGHGDKEYLVHGDWRISFAEHLGLVARCARSLREP